MTESPDCRDGNHNKCDGTAWDLQTDAETRCSCPHHQRGGYVQNTPTPTKTT